MSPVEIGIFRVSVASDIDNQRLSVCGDFNAQRVVMPVTAVADVSAVENQKAFVFKRSFTIAPTASLCKITAFAKVGVEFFGRKALPSFRRRVKKIRSREN